MDDRLDNNGGVPLAVRLVRFGAGTDAYRRRHQVALMGELPRSDSRYLHNVLERTHLASNVCPWLPANSELAQSFTPLRTYLRLITRVAALELRRLGRRLEKTPVRPVLLKGPSLWGRVYSRRWVRRLHDLDVLITEPGHMPFFLQALEAGGYRTGASAEAITSLADTHYELPTYTKQIEVGVARSVIRQIERLKEVSAFDLRVDISDSSHVVVHLDVEPHRGMFIYRDGTLPPVHDDALCESGLFPSFMNMRFSLLLPYLSLKFIMDAQRAIDIDDGTAKCVKLMADLVQVLARATSGDVARSIALARDLRIAPEYHAALSNACAFAPDLELRNLMPSGGPNLVDQLAWRVVHHAGTGRQVRERHETDC